jgi:hypothetical protein
MKTQNEAKNQQVLSDEFKAEASNVLDFSATLKDLKNNFDPELVRHRKASKDRNGNANSVDHVAWHTVADILDKAAPNWEHSIKDVRSIGDFAIVTAAITIDGITREGIGTGSARSEVGIKKAEHDALKRAAVKFGIARDLYRSEEASADEQPMETALSFNGDPIARTMSEMVSTKQLGMIRAVAREANVDGDLACRNLLRCEVNELSRRAASFFIDHLRELDTQAVPFKKAG